MSLSLSDVGSNAARELAFKPHLHSLDSYDVTVEALLSTNEYLYKRGMAVWIIGLIFQLSDDDDKHCLKKIR